MRIIPFKSTEIEITNQQYYVDTKSTVLCRIKNLKRGWYDPGKWIILQPIKSDSQRLAKHSHG